MSDRERQNRSKEVTAKLKALNHKAGIVVRDLYDEVELAVTDISKEIRHYLQMTQSKTKLISNWGRKDGELLDMEYASATWDWVKRRIDQVFNDRLTDLLEEWDEQSQYIPSLEKKLFREAKLNLCELESELAEIEHDRVNDDHLSRSGNLSSVSLSAAAFCASIEDFEDEGLTKSQVPKKLAHRLKSFMAKTMKKRHEESKLKDYKKDPKHVTEKKAKKLLDAMIKDKDKRLESFIRNFLQRPYNYIRQLENKIPNMVRSNMTLQEKLNQEIKEQLKHQKHYQEMMVRIEKVRRDLILYGEDNFCGSDFQESEVTLIEMSFVSYQGHKVLKKGTMMGDLMQRSASRSVLSQIPHGLWHEVHLGEINKGSEKQNVVVKIYSQQANIENMLQEVAKLRCLLHNDVCIAEFLGIYQRKDHPTPALIFSGHLFSVRHYVKTCDVNPSARMLMDVLTGLQYLHNKGLVHIELTTDTVTVSPTGDVQLSGQCLPRKCIQKEKSENCLSDFVYLAPEVLKGEIYFASADMYSFALFAVEVFNHSFQAFSEFRNKTVKEFLETSQKLLIELEIEKLPQVPLGVKQLLLRCLEQDPKLRPDASSLAAEFKEK